MSRAKERGHDIHFVWIPSHVGILRHDHADRLEKSACDKQSADVALGVPLARISHIIKTSFKEDLSDA